MQIQPQIGTSKRTRPVAVFHIFHIRLALVVILLQAVALVFRQMFIVPVGRFKGQRPDGVNVFAVVVVVFVEKRPTEKWLEDVQE